MNAYDEEVIRRALRGEPVRLVDDDRAEVIRRIKATGQGPAAIQKILRCNGRDAKKLWEAT